MSRKEAAAAVAGTIEGFLMQANPGQFNAVLAGKRRVVVTMGKRERSTNGP